MNVTRPRHYIAVMIKFSLRCAEDHSFDCWFQSNQAFDKLDASGMLSCPVCGSSEVRKSVMTPQVRSSSDSTEPETRPDLSAPLSPAETAVREMRKLLDEKFENVGRKFAAEARAMHEGEAPKRSIIGEASLHSAAGLLKDGIPVLPVPWSTSQKTN